MASDFIPQELDNLNVKFKLIKTRTKKVLGQDETEEEEIGYIFANFKSKGGTESTLNGKLVIEDTADIVTHWRPDIKSDCILERVDDGARYEIVGEPEDYSFRHIALGFSVRRLKGKYNGQVETTI